MTKSVLNIDHNIFLDFDLARHHFEDFKHNTEYDHHALFLEDNRNGISYLVIGDLDSPRFTQEDFDSHSEDEIREILEMCEVYYEDETKEEMKEEFLSITQEEYYRKTHENRYYQDLPYTFRINGYSQGDEVKVQIIDPDFEPTKWITEQFLSNLFYDAPFYGVITYLDKEIYVDGFMDSVYEWDKDEFLKNFKADYKGPYLLPLLAYCEANLPEILE